MAKVISPDKVEAWAKLRATGVPVYKISRDYKTTTRVINNALENLGRQRAASAALQAALGEEVRAHQQQLFKVLLDFEESAKEYFLPVLEPSPEGKTIIRLKKLAFVEERNRLVLNLPPGDPSLVMELCQEHLKHERAGHRLTAWLKELASCLQSLLAAYRVDRAALEALFQAAGVQADVQAPAADDLAAMLFEHRLRGQTPPCERWIGLRPNEGIRTVNHTLIPSTAALELDKVLSELRQRLTAQELKTRPNATLSAQLKHLKKVSQDVSTELALLRLSHWLPNSCRACPRLGLP
jgi:hypothetical protein